MIKRIIIFTLFGCGLGLAILSPIEVIRGNPAYGPALITLNSGLGTLFMLTAITTWRRTHGTLSRNPVSRRPYPRVPPSAPAHRR